MINNEKWTDEYIKEYLLQLIEKDNIEIVDIPKKITIDYILKNEMGVPFITKFNGCRFELINFVFENKFSKEVFEEIEIEKNSKQKNTRLKWTNEYIKEYLVSLMIRDNISIKDLPKIVSVIYLRTNGMATPLMYKFKGSRYNLINFVFPNVFTQKEFRKLTEKGTKNVKWTKEIIIQKTKEMIEFEKIELSDIPTIFSARYLVDKGFSFPLMTFFDGSPYEFFNLVYPNQFSKKEFIRASKERRVANILKISDEELIEKVRNNIEKKLNFKIEEIPEKVTYNDIIKLKVEKPFRRFNSD